MKTRAYNDLYDLIKALCGVEFALIEQPRIQAFINRRAHRAYNATNYWTRFLVVGEQRQVTDGYVVYDEAGLGLIGTFLRIFSAKPYSSTSAGEFQFTVDGNGAALISSTSLPTSVYVTYKISLDDVYVANTSDIPDEWFEYMAHGVYADYLRAEGQQEKAALADQEANDILLDQLMKLDEQHTQTIVSNRIFTNSNMQYRSY